jgi:phosphoribosylformylglycinamidine synthase
MSDILAGRVDLNDFKGLVACGGFSYGDVLGAGEGWAKSALFNSRARDAFQGFFERNDSFALGVCNGCQMMSNLHELIPGSEFWPHFVRNRSEQFEARVAMVQSAGVELDLPAGHGRFAHADRHRPRRRPCRVRQRRSAAGSRSVRLRGHALRRQPRQGHRSLPGQPERLAARITGLTSRDGRVTIMMPHPERVPRRAELVAPGRLERRRPWMRMFRNARVWVN